MTNEAKQLTDRELDALVAEKVMGWEVLDVGYFGSADETPRQLELQDWMEEVGLTLVGRYAIDVEAKSFRLLSEGYGSWRPSTDISAAMEVVEKMRERDFAFAAQTIHLNATAWRATFDDAPRLDPPCVNQSVTEWSVMDNSLPRAICLAVLPAVEVTIS